MTSPIFAPQRDPASRRTFLNHCAGCLAASGCLLARPCAAQEPIPAPEPKPDRPRIRLVFSHVPPGQPTWPHSEYDYEARKRDLARRLTEACPGIELVPATVHSTAEAQALVAADPGVHGYLAYMVGIWTGAPAVLAATGKPTLFVDDLYAGTGEFLVAFAAARRAGRNVAGIASTRFADVIAAARMFQNVRDPAAAARFASEVMAVARLAYKAPGDTSPTMIDAPPPVDVSQAIERLRSAAILLVGQPMQSLEPAITAAFGTRVIPIPFEQLEAAHRAADPDHARALASEVIARAQAVVEPREDDIIRGMAMYLGMKQLMRERQAEAVTVNCLGGFYGGHLTAYPCLGFARLNDDGHVGACEADLKSTITMMLMTGLVGRPGYISDPVIDTARNQIIYAHCVAPTRVDGPAGPAAPYQIRTHSEDRKGASIRSLLPTDRLTTSLEIDPQRRQILVHQARTVENIDEEKACRTKLAAEVRGDIDRLMSAWDQWGWHRVTYYGDLRAPINELADRIGFSVVQEA